MDYYSNQMSKLIEELSCLPGIGAKSAARLAFHLIHMPVDDVKRLASTMVEARENIKYCKECYTLTDQELCPICSNSNRDHQKMCIRDRYDGAGDWNMGLKLTFYKKFYIFNLYIAYILSLIHICPEYLSHGLHRCLRGSHGRHVSGHLRTQGITLWYVYKYAAGRYTRLLCADIPCLLYTSSIGNWSEITRHSI